MYLLLGIAITLAFLLIVNMAAAFVASLAWHLFSGPISSLSANVRAQIIFGLRVGPVAAAAVFVFAFVIPSYLLLEPANSGEVVSGKLAFIASVSSIAVFVAVLRVLRTWQVTRTLEASWRSDAVELRVDGINARVYGISHPFPVMAVIGIFRPRMFVAKQVLDSLSQPEFEAAVAHECAHLKSHDNLKRTILQVCRDLVIAPFGKNLDRAWAENVESAADEHAALTKSSIALDLASALVKLARIAPHGSPRATFSGSFLFDARCVDVTERVRRLLGFADNSQRPAKRMLSLPRWVWPAAMTCLLVFHIFDQRLLLRTHEAIERFVWMIQ